MIKRLTRRDLREVEEVSHRKFWDGCTTTVEVKECDPSLAGHAGDFVGSDGIKRTVEIVIRIIPHE